MQVITDAKELEKHTYIKTRNPAVFPKKERLGLRLNGKTQILPLKNGIDFLGFHTYLTQTGKVVSRPPRGGRG